MPLPKSIVILLSSLLLLSSCAPNPEQTPPITTTIRPATLKRLPTTPPKKNTIILTISGNIQTTNQNKTLILDRTTIEKLQTVEYKIFDLFERKYATFEGVFLTDLINLSQPTTDAKTITITAINDYQIQLPIETIKELKILFALKQNGQYMTVNYRGPAMLIVPPYQNNPNAPNSQSRASYWIWQIESILIE